MVLSAAAHSASQGGKPYPREQGRSYGELPNSGAFRPVLTGPSRSQGTRSWQRSARGPGRSLGCRQHWSWATSAMMQVL